MKRLHFLVIVLAIACTSAYADSIGARGAVAENNADEDFEAYELFAVFDLPWAWERGDSRWQTQLEVMGGVLRAAGESGSMGAIAPRIAWQADGLSIHLGGGIAALGETEFGEQDFGGSAQFIAHIGLAFALTDRLHAGVRYRHLSDGEMHEVGEDLNLLLLEVFSISTSSRAATGRASP